MQIYLLKNLIQTMQNFLGLEQEITYINNNIIYLLTLAIISLYLFFDKYFQRIFHWIILPDYKNVYFLTFSRKTTQEIVQGVIRVRHHQNWRRFIFVLPQGAAL